MSTKTKRTEVARLTYFVVQTFKAVKGTKGKISADDPVAARDHDHAMRLFDRYKSVRAGVVAFRRTGDPATGDWEDAVIIARHGQLSPEADRMTDASDTDFLSEHDLKVA